MKKNKNSKVKENNKLRVIDSELQLKIRRKFININNSELNIGDRIMPNKEDKLSLSNMSNLRRIRLEMIKSRSKFC